ncbi:hypothetical protein [Halobacteriovorax sp. RT-2-5]|uniref:hypothetical protein n=1 Tax=unclassified Halobacteriovorax TaxID=2639665 RepID=UPI00399B0A1F
MDRSETHLVTKVESEAIIEYKAQGKEVAPLDQSVEKNFERELNDLPIVSDIQKLSPSEVHHTPEIIKNAGELVGAIHAQAQAQPLKRYAAMTFFKSCAEDSEVIRSIRAVCLKKIYKLMPEWKIATVLSHEKIPESVSSLAFKLP